jgi:hypothetical protein
LQFSVRVRIDFLFSFMAYCRVPVIGVDENLVDIDENFLGAFEETELSQPFGRQFFLQHLDSAVPNIGSGPGIRCSALHRFVIDPAKHMATLKWVGLVFCE